MEQSGQIKVAAFNAPKGEKACADFRCDGVSDDVEINAAMDLPGKVNLLKTKYGASRWFKETSDYLGKRCQQIEERMSKAFKFVTLSRDNGPVYSYEFSSILRDTGSSIISVLDMLIRSTTTKPRKYYNFRDYCLFLGTSIPDIHLRSVSVNSLFPMVLIPFSALGTAQPKPKWWLAYTKVKHSEVSDCKQANLSNALGSLAALAILGALLGCFIRSELFVNVGLVYPPGDPAVSSERILFEMT
jgi:hypothetical protein